MLDQRQRSSFSPQRLCSRAMSQPYTLRVRSAIPTWSATPTALGGKWTLRRRDNDIVLECDRLAIDATQFYYAICQTISADKRGYVANEYGGPATAKACNSIGALSCEAGCVISGKKSVEASTRTGWERMCRSETGRGSPEIPRGDNEAEASILAFCSETK